jgi:hypothetical protein
MLSQWGQFDKQLGRSEVESADPEGRVLLWEEASVADIKARFAQLGFKPRQVPLFIIVRELFYHSIFCCP